MHYAHSTGELAKGDWQPLDVHLRSVAALAGHFAAFFEARRAGELAGLLHDVGKYTDAFQERLEGARTRVDHSTAGAAILIDRGRIPSGESVIDRVVMELLAYAIAGHHGGLPDGGGVDGSLRDRVTAFDLRELDPAWMNEVSIEPADLCPESFIGDRRGGQAPAFQFGFFGRMLFSCLVDADFKDTERFYAAVEGRAVDREWSDLEVILPDLIERFDSHMAAKAAAQGAVNARRREILAAVRGRAGDAPGAFTLTVPTGGGKTLASLAFALDHARLHDHRRIIYAIPFTSIIDQTANVFREVLGDDVVLEHHSAIDEAESHDRAGREKLKLAMEDWAAPLVVTTTVQLFESLFANRPSRCRKLHNIAGSIIILDEAQNMPAGLLKPAVMALDELVRNYGVTVVLCTATQPALDRRDYANDPLMGLDLDGRELAPDPSALSQAFRRVTMRRAGLLSDDDLVAELTGRTQGLVIVNSRAHALALYRAAEGAGLEGAIHLTTRQCAAHRREILTEIRARLKNDEPCRVIATSLVEAGVDLDFPRVWRAEAGLDSVEQAAGRCNREGARPVDESIVTVFRPADHAPPGEIRQMVEAFRSTANAVSDLRSPEAIRHYFRELYWRKTSGLDAKGILDRFRMDARGTDMAYRTVAEDFRMIEEGMEPVIVPFDATAQKAIDQLEVEAVPSGRIAHALQRYVVQVPPPARRSLIESGDVCFAAPTLRADQFAVLRRAELYHKKDVGLLWEEPGIMDTLIV